MLNSVSQSPSHNRSPLAQWIRKTVWSKGVTVKFRIRGNNLNILCESPSCPDQAVVLTRVLMSLQQQDLNTLLPRHHTPIYQILLFARKRGRDRPNWVYSISLNQVDRHLEQLQQHLNTANSQTIASGQDAVRMGQSAQAMMLENPTRSQHSSGSALMLSNRSLARQGSPEGIARYLSETLSQLGIAVRVAVKTLPYTVRTAALPTTSALFQAEEEAPVQRLWITCEATYSPDPKLVGEPVAKQLRELELEGFRDAVILIQVRGEDQPDWMLRVDLTPIRELLREWARWGDVEAIARLLRQAVSDRNLTLSTASLQSSTLHLFFSQPTETAPDPELVESIVLPLLETLGPQGIHAATLYGQQPGQEAPAWVKWLVLPAAKHPALADPPLTLAKQGDWGAIAFLLHRLLNPDLDQFLTTGGIRTQLLPKQDLLHIMADAPICPAQKQVGPTIAQFFRQLHLSQITGVRIYGRRAGQKRPMWSYGIDFTKRDRFVPEAIPEFAATDAYIGDLLAKPGDPVLRPDLTPEDLRNAWSQFWQGLRQKTQYGLVRSQLFTPIPEVAELPSLPASGASYRGIAVTLIWGAVGLLLTLQLNWGLYRLLQAQQMAEAAAAENILANQDQRTLSPDALTDPNDVPEAADSLPVESDEPPVFSSSRFVQTEDWTGAIAEQPDLSEDGVDLPYSEESPEARLMAAAILSEESPFPTFNSLQLDQKLQLYYQRLEESGPPDVLILGSSRALRGVDPIALEAALAELGYTDVEVFNFGINGATAQVADLVLRRLLPADQLPRLVIWADGARAFNSNTVDVTYNGIAQSEGYRDLAAGRLPALTATDVQPASSAASETPDASLALSDGIGSSLTASYQDIDRWLSDRLGQVATLHQERDRLKGWVQDRLTAFFPAAAQPLTVADTLPTELPIDPDTGEPTSSLLVSAGQDMIDLHGFLPLSIRFNPATYYQQYARVPGEYDSDYEKFEVDGKQSAALQSLLQFSQEQGIPIVFVNLPLTEDYLDPVRLEYEEMFRQYMLDISVNQGSLVFRDLGEQWLTEYDYFSDPSHLNRYGAYQVALRLAQDPMIPWAIAAQPDSNRISASP